MTETVLKKESLTLTRNQIILTKEYLENVEYLEPIDNQFRKLCSENIASITKYIDELALPEAFPDTDGIVEYNEKQQSIQDKFIDDKLKIEKSLGLSEQKDLDGADEELKENFSNKVNELVAKSKAESKKLEDDNSSLIEAQTEVNEARDKFLLESDTIDLYLIDVAYLPQYKTPSVEGVNHWTVWDILNGMSFINE
jgi:hypothetical protein